QLRQIDEARSELIALVTHELRTPLAVVRAYTELLGDDPPLEGRESRDPDRRAQRQAWHDAAMDQVERLDRLVDSILASVRIVPALVEGFVRIGVPDQGPGVPEEWRERIFEPYARRETHTARGSGIGLYAAKRLGESMGARLWVEPADPTGARFVVALPAVA